MGEGGAVVGGQAAGVRIQVATFLGAGAGEGAGAGGDGLVQGRVV
jgi:hypothetical protein